mgnify:CR=1 FL=1
MNLKVSNLNEVILDIGDQGLKTIILSINIYKIH